jgi:hypothetical protein
MSLTGVPLIIVAVLATAAAGAGTVLLWSRYGRWRMFSRTIGILLTETLVAATVGLVSNRVEMFYPSWAALEGRTGTTVVPATQPAGRLDGLVHGAAAAVLPWHPAGAAAWRLAGAPRVVLPADYRNRPSVTYPAMVSLVDTGVEAAAAVRAARGVAAVGLVAVPTAGTAAAALATLPAQLTAAVRVNGRGWAVEATARQAGLAAQLVRSAPGTFGALAVVGAAALARQDRPAGLALAVLPAGPVQAAWLRAAKWAAGHTTPALAAPLRLPQAHSPVLAGADGRVRRR